MAHSPDPLSGDRPPAALRAGRPHPRRRRRRPRHRHGGGRGRDRRRHDLRHRPRRRRHVAAVVRGALAGRRSGVRGSRRAGRRRPRPGLDGHRRHHRRHAGADVRQATRVVPRRRRTPRRDAARRRRRGDDRAPDREAGRGRPAQRDARRGRRRGTDRPARRARTPLVVRPSTATDLEHGFAGLAKFFPPGKPALAALEAELFARLGSRHVFDDEYISSGGQLHELISGHDRFVADLRPLVDVDALACHPYDVCTAMLLEEAGGVVTDPSRRAARRAVRHHVPGRVGGLREPRAGGAHRPGARGARR